MSFLTPALIAGLVVGAGLIALPRPDFAKRMFLLVLGVAVLIYVVWLLIKSVIGLDGSAIENTATDFALGALTIIGLRDALSVIKNRKKRR